MRIANYVVYIVLLGLLSIPVFLKKTKRAQLFGKRVRDNYLLIIVLLFFNSISLVCSLSDENKDVVLVRNDISGSEKNITIVLEKEKEQYPFQLQLKQLQLSPTEMKKRMSAAFLSLEKTMKWENKNLDQINTNMKFDLDYSEFPFDMDVIPDQYLLMDENGKIRNSEEELLAAGYTKKQAEKGISTGVTIRLFYGDVEEERHYDLIIFPKEMTSKERLFSNVKKIIEQKELEYSNEKELQLPAFINGIKVYQEKNIATNPIFVLGMGVVICGLILLQRKENEFLQRKKKEELLRRSYPGFVNEMVLLLGAGMQVRNIFELLIREYETDSANEKRVAGKKQKKEENPLIQELRVAKQNFEMGMAEEKVYYQLGRRLKLSCYIKIMSLLEQNVKKGSKGLAIHFEQEVRNAFEEQKQLAKRLGEEAGTKMLGPMMLQLLVVMLIIMIPAFMSF